MAPFQPATILCFDQRRARGQRVVRSRIRRERDIPLALSSTLLSLESVS